MKVIELLNRIANDEAVPKWVVYNKKEYTYMEEYKDYVHEVYNNGTMLFLLSEIFTKNGIDIVLNQELDFIEEENKIEKLDLILDEHFSNDELQAYIKETQEKVNEIIDKINKENI